MKWNAVKEKLSHKIPESALSLWIEPLKCIRADDELFELAAPDRFFCSWVAKNYLQEIKECLAQFNEKTPEIRFSIDQTQEKTERPLLTHNKSDQLRLPSMPKARSYVRSLHPRFTFDEFMTGESNALARTACEALANDSVDHGQCIYIDSGTGLGKSHLTHAVAHHILNNSPGTRLHYLTAQQLTAEMVRNIKNNSMEEFKGKYNNHCDVLLMEDVHTLSGRTKTQEELASVVDTLLEKGKRIIFTGAMPPRKIENIDTSFRSRLSSGLVSTINPPDFQTRINIINRKATNSKLDLSEELVNYIAENIRGDIRQTESAIVGLKAKSSLLKTIPDLDMVKEVIANIVGHQQFDLSTEVIRNFIARQFKTSIDDLRSKSRKKAVAFPRQIAMYLARKLTDQALSDIGKAFNRDHSTVVHSIRVISDTIARNVSVRGQVELLTEKLKKQN
ncbi:MAG: chromosomal replication initiator protein DnaA [Proteobacteria bacterium]|nr:chromosomal replication initiator protein DnaA [Pseudomonadota bacterium]MBU1715330.1 chromosomal replication initiator protein DnaA [Pseudomonadota bacterium]